MIYPIVVYGDPVLRKVAEDVPAGTDLKKLIEDMYDTMYAASGMGLAAPQIGKSIRLFIVDTTMYADEPDLKDFKKVFVNPIIHEITGEDDEMEEGCLSIPNIREKIVRKDQVRLTYLDANWQPHDETYTGLKARVIQHEYDHIEGRLFLDYLSPLRKKLLKGKLQDISKGDVPTDYRIAAPLKK